MRRLFQAFGNIRMTTAIVALVFVAIIGSIATVSGAIYMSLHAQSIADSRVRQETDLAVAAMSTTWNYGDGWEAALIDAYGVEPDPVRLAFYRDLWNAT